MRKRKVFGKNLTTLSFLTALTVFTWIAFDVYRALVKHTDPNVSKKILEPIKPDFDKNTLDELKERIFLDEDQLNSVPDLTEFQLTEKEATPSTEQEEGSIEEEVSRSDQETSPSDEENI